MTAEPAQIKILRANQVYRIVDLVLCKGIRWQQDRATILSDPEYRETILYGYLTKMKHERDLETFARVVGEHQARYEHPAPDSLVVHVRLGDVMEDAIERPLYQRSKQLYGGLGTRDFLGLKQATIVTALHFGANPLNKKYFYSDLAMERSFEILELLSRELEHKGMHVSYRSSENIDEDVCFMAGSRYFVMGLSDLSGLIGECLPDGALIWSLHDNRLYRKAR